MSRSAWGLLILFWSTLSYAQSIPTVVQWIDVFEKVRQHGLFADLNITYAKAPAANVGFSPVGVIPRDGVDCVIVIAEGDNPKMEKMMQLAATPAAARAFLLTLAAHEFGHCFRIRSKHLSRELWERVAATTAGSAERGVLEKLLSIEEAYADAYAFAYLHDTLLFERQERIGAKISAAEKSPDVGSRYSLDMDAVSYPGLLVDQPEIDEVLDLDTGEILPSWKAVGNDYEKVLQLRMNLMQGNRSGHPVYACPLCAVPVHLVSMMKERGFYFRHETEDGRCPSKTKGQLSGERILAMKYDGARESAAHIRMKEIIASSLRLDHDFSDVQIEPIWKGSEANSRRRPDVRAVWRGSLPVAFEVQLSTTFLRVIAERRAFYLKESGLLLWVFKSFDMGNAKLTQDDIFYNNNRNAFAASDSTLEASRCEGRLVLDCVWSEPSIDQGQLTWSQHRRSAAFSELTVEQETQRVYLLLAAV